MGIETHLNRSRVINLGKYSQKKNERKKENLGKLHFLEIDQDLLCTLPKNLRTSIHIKLF